jgi:hypothetical protein
MQYDIAGDITYIFCNIEKITGAAAPYGQDLLSPVPG